MTARNWIGVATVITAYLWTAGWLLIGHRPQPQQAIAVEDEFFIPLDSDDKYSTDNLDCRYAVKDGKPGLLCRGKGEEKP